MKTLLSLLVASLLTLSAHAQGATFLTYRAGAVVTQDEMGPVNLNEFQLRLPGLKWASKDGLSFQSAFGYHHASMGSDHRFWGSAPMDAFLFEGSVDVPVGANSVLTAGTSVRWTRVCLPQTVEWRPGRCFRSLPDHAVLDRTGNRGGCRCHAPPHDSIRSQQRDSDFQYVCSAS